MHVQWLPLSIIYRNTLSPCSTLGTKIILRSKPTGWDLRFSSHWLTKPGAGCAAIRNHQTQQEQRRSIIPAALSIVSFLSIVLFFFLMSFSFGGLPRWWLRGNQSLRRRSGDAAIEGVTVLVKLQPLVFTTNSRSANKNNHPSFMEGKAFEGSDSCCPFTLLPCSASQTSAQYAARLVVVQQWSDMQEIKTLCYVCSIFPDYLRKRKKTKNIRTNICIDILVGWHH